MKKIIITMFLFTAFLAVMLTGCATTQNITQFPDGTSVTNVVTKLDPARTAAALRVIVVTGTRIAVTQDPESREYLSKAQLAICTAAAAGQVSPEQLKSAVDATGIKELKTPEAQVAISSVYGIYQAYYGDVVAQKLNQNEWLVPVLAAICEGLSDGLTTDAPVP